MGSRLGQHFLKDDRALRKIAASLEIGPRDTVIEIGPGHGELTKHLLTANPQKLIAIERDPRLADALRKTPPNGELDGKRLVRKLEIIEGDALKTLPAFINESSYKSYKVVGNIPYYITGHLLRILGELEPKPKVIVLMIQKEVAERICAKPPKMNLLAASIQFWAKPTIEMIIKSGSFSPPPKVDSAVLKLEPGRPANIDPARYYRTIKILFKQPRKTIINNLRMIGRLSKTDLENTLKDLGIAGASRPSNLSINEIAKLASVF